MNDNEIRYIYVGRADKPYGPWDMIQDTPEERQKAIAEGYTAFSTMSFAYEPEKGKPEPVRYGDFIMDIDCKHGAGSDLKFCPDMAIARAKDLLERLAERIQVDPGYCRFYLSGRKGCHIEIPAAVFGGEAGHPELPLIHKHMARALQGMAFAPAPIPNILDLSLYCMGRGHLLRCPNIKRGDNGRYKVPVSAWEFFNLDYPDLERLTLEPRIGFDAGTKEPVLSPRLAELYADAIGSIRAFNNRANPVSGIEALLNCDFIAHCSKDRDTLPEPHWWAMIRIMASFGEAGRKLIHELSQGYPGYSFEETEKKINTPQMRQGRGPIGCEYIRNLPFECGKQCGVRSPADLWKYRRSEETRRAMNFFHKKDGLYRQSETGDGEPVRVCSPLKVLGKMRNSEGAGWARLVEITTSDGRKKEVSVFMRDMKGRGEVVISLLLDHGLELSPTSSKAQSYLMEYLMNGAPNDLPLLCVQRVGWTGDTYILPDASFGGELEEKIHFQTEGTDNLYQVSGTLAEWQEHVGRYCRGNSLLELLTCYALTGPLLRLVGLEGGGIHVFGESSTGKSTLAMVVGSVCGGGGPRGYILQWRTTDNALEVGATLHNDNLMILDEISQARAEDVSRITYMLANGQGKARLRADASRRPLHKWHLNFLSTGEQTINDKIQEFGKYTTLAGQEIRVIDLPIDGLETENTFQELHGLTDGGKLSELLSYNACRYYGTPFRAFMTALCADLEANTAFIKKEMEAFVSEYCPPDASGQVRRVARKLSLPAAAGELGISFGVLPFDVGASKKAAGEWFNIWLSHREGHGNLENIKAIKNLQDYIARHSGTSRFIDLDSPSPYPPHTVDGYTWSEGDEKWYLLLTPAFNEQTKGVNRKALLAALDRLGCLAHTSAGTIKTNKWVNGRNMTGVVFIPSSWEGKPDPEELEEERQKAMRNVDALFK
ncbi:hypothetical protein C4J81_16050 [Deltaproteobacteria bacterium Smac51]|nr:hypothetical protein C4J81_16050 [Deltaproteobacteria bacterium Smac51]